MPVTIDQHSARQPNRPEEGLDLARAWDAAQWRAPDDEDPRTTQGPVSPERLQLANAGIYHLSPIVRELVELWQGPEHDEYGRLRPTKEAFDAAIHVLVDAAIESGGRPIPDGCVSTDSEGGVRIEWVRHAVNVHLVAPATDPKGAYIYHEVGNEYATEAATPEGLSRWLRDVR